MTASARPPLTRAVVIGVTGRMGRALLRAAPGFPQLLITGAIASASSLALGRDAGEVAGVGITNLIVSDDLPAALAQADVAIDFSHGSVTATTVEACRAARRPLLIGTTGYAPELDAQLAQAAGEIALMVTANTSVGVAVLMELTRRAAQALPSAFDIDILELHHRGKRDAPSGTALALGRAAARGATLAPQGAAQAAPGERSEGQVGFATVRAGDIVGEHTVLFSGAGEELILTHRAQTRDIFARGALAAALWLAPRPPGRYGMTDFIGEKTLA